MPLHLEDSMHLQGVKKKKDYDTKFKNINNSFILERLFDIIVLY